MNARFHGTRFDPSSLLEKEACDGGEGHVHLRIQKRSGRKSLTIVQGLNRGQAEKTLKRLRKRLCCNGTITVDERFGAVLQLQGDQREAVKSYLSERRIVPTESIKVHGY